MNSATRGKVLSGGRTAISVLAAVSLLASCTLQNRDVETEQGNQISRLQAQVLRLERSLQEVRSTPAAPPYPQDLGQRLADLGQQTESLASDVRRLSGRVDSFESQPKGKPEEALRISQIENRIAALAKQVEMLDARAVASTSAPIPAPTPSPSTGRRDPSPAAPQPDSRSQEPAPQDLYDRAYALYKQGKYVEAREDFQRYAGLYPDTNLTDNAYFWIGESFYDQGQYEQAILGYDKVVQSFPNGDKVPSALLKQAFAFDAIGGPSDAKILLRKLIREHSTSEQAAIARRKLEILED